MPSPLPENNPFRASVLPETQVLLAGQDLLTGLSSRAGLDAHYRLAVARARRSGARCAVGVVVVGVDPTQPPDDVFGHDLAVVEAAKRLRATLRETDLIARVGETRFAFVAEDVPPDGVDAIVGRVLQALAAPVANAGAPSSPRVGLALWESPDQTLPLLLRKAEQALTTEEALAAHRRPVAANAESFGPGDEAASEPPRTPARSIARRAVGWLSLAMLLALALSATPRDWRDRWLPLHRMAERGWNAVQAERPPVPGTAIRRP
jgi:diguanylate cyclase (GGDEF)-like protein